jgi:hypothetical protein
MSALLNLLTPMMPTEDPPKKLSDGVQRGNGMLTVA